MALKTAYTVYLHLEEVRDLVPTSGPSSLADPYVLVSCAGRSQRTEIVRSQINVNFDRMFIFTDIMLTQDEFERQNIHVQVFNANVIFRNELIGQYSYGFKKVWSQPEPSQHQIHRRWVVLINPDDPEDEQGYMLATVTVLGPGDIPPRPKDAEDETSEVLRAPIQIGKQRRGYNILFRIFRGENMLKVQRDGCDGFISVKFNGVSMKTSPDYATTSPEWNTLLTFPVYTPCLTDNIDVQFWDYEGTGPDKLLATLTLRFSDILSDQISPTWFNLYKVPTAEMPWFGNAPKVDKVQQTEFAGRLLMSVSANITDIPERMEKSIRPVQAPQSCEYVLHVDLYETSTLAGVGGFLSWQDVKVEVCYGHVKMWTNSATEIYEDKAKTKLKGYRFTCNTLYSGLPTDDENYKKCCRFQQVNMQLPRLTEKDSKQQWDQLFDLILNVYDGENNRIGLCRYDSHTLIKKTDTDMSIKPEWHPIRGVEQDGAVRTRGFILFHAALKSVKKADPAPPRPPCLEVEENVMFQVRAHIYMARELVPDSGESLVSPFVRVSIGGRHLKLLVPFYKDYDKKLERDVWKECKESDDLKLASALREHPTMEQTGTVKDSRNPIWMQTLHGKVMLNKVSDSEMSLSMAPDIVVTVYDEGREGEDYVGRATYPPILCTKERWKRTVEDEKSKKMKREPIWLELQHEDLNYNRDSTFANEGGDKETKTGVQSIGRSEGKILVLFEVIDEDNIDDEEEASLDGNHTWPAVINAKIQLISLGLRNLKVPGGYPATNPQFKLIVPNFPNRFQEKRARMLIADNDTDDDDDSSASDNTDADTDGDEGGSDSDGSESGSDSDDDGEEGNRPPTEKKHSDKDFLLSTRFIWDSSEFFTNGESGKKQLLKASSSPYQKWEEIIFNVKVPRDAYYSSHLTVIVTQKGGLLGTEEIISSRDIPLAPYASDTMYDSHAKYRARAHIVDNVKLKQFWHMEKSLKKGEDDDGDDNDMFERKDAIEEKKREDGDGDDEEEEEEEENIEIEPITPCINLDPDSINMIFEKELTDYHLEGEVSGEEESSTDDSEEDEKEEAVFWPGDFNNDDENLGRKHFDTSLEEQKDVVSPIYETWYLYPGASKDLDNAVGALKGILTMWTGEGSYQDAQGNSKTHAISKEQPPWFNRLESKTEGGRERVPPNVWLSDLDADKMEELDKNHTEHYKCRIYILKGFNLAPLATSNSSNPYIVVTMHDKAEADALLARGFDGHFSFRDESNVRPNTVNPDFNFWHELDGMFPCISSLEVAVYDRGYVTDTLIGSTTIDLEDRWFDKEWRRLRDIQQVPRENRTLFNHSSMVPQGKVEMWVEMYEPKTAVDIPIVPIEAPQITEWELRLVVWETRKVPKIDDKRYTNMYVTGELLYFTRDGEKSAKQIFETDTHDGVRDGSGKFNWRMKYNLPVPCKNPRLRIQVLDYSMFGVDGFVCESVINLNRIVKQALATQEEVAKPKQYFRLSSSNFPGQGRGEVDLQINLLPIREADKKPVGAAREKPNDDPFLPEPVRKVRSMFSSNFMIWVRRIVILSIIGGALAFSIIGTGVSNQAG